MNAAERGGFIRLYDNGDAGGRTLKWFVSKRLADGLGIKEGDVYELQERYGQLELELVEVKTRVAPGRRPTASEVSA